MTIVAKINEKKAKASKTRAGFIKAIAPLLAVAAFILIWQLLVVVLKIPSWKIPMPTNVFRTMFTDFGEFAPNIWLSCSNIVIGFVFAVIIGITLAAVISNFPVVGSTLTPFINFMCTTPMITFVPLLMLWMGLGNKVKILVIILQAFPIVLMNSVTGFINVSQMKLEVMKSLRANRISTFFLCVLPDALPNVFTGVKLSSVLAIIVGVAAETVGGSKGLGAQIVQYTQFMQMDKAFACIFFIIIFGIALFSLLSYIEKKIITWKI